MDPPTNPESPLAGVARRAPSSSTSHLTAALTSLVPMWLRDPFASFSQTPAVPLPPPSPPSPPAETNCYGLRLTSEVSRTSQTCAAARAAESTLPPSERLFIDRLSAHLSGAAASRSRPPSPRIAIRTRYFDDFASKKCRAPDGIDQLVILGAGMDTRAYRLSALSATIVYEVDVAEVIALKTKLLSAAKAAGAYTTFAAAAVERVTADVVEPGWDGYLVAAGFDWKKPSVFVIEGLVYYLPDDLVRALLRTVKRLASDGSVMCMSIVGEISERRKPVQGDDQQAADGKERTIPMFVFACPQPRLFLGNLGFIVDEVVQLGGEGANYGRWPKGEPPAANTMYVTFRPDMSKT